MTKYIWNRIYLGENIWIFKYSAFTAILYCTVLYCIIPKGCRAWSPQPHHRVAGLTSHNTVQSRCCREYLIVLSKRKTRVVPSLVTHIKKYNLPIIPAFQWHKVFMFVITYLAFFGKSPGVKKFYHEIKHKLVKIYVVYSSDPEELYLGTNFCPRRNSYSRRICDLQ